MRRVLFPLMIVLALANAAHAGNAKFKSRNTALTLGGLGTGVSATILVTSAFLGGNSEQPVNVPLFAAGLASATITPSLGQFYASEYLTIGMGIRAVSAGVAAYAVFALDDTYRCNIDKRCADISQAGVVVLGLASLGFIGGVAYDLQATIDAVDRENKKHGFYMGISMTPLRTVDHSTIPALSLSGRF